MATDIMYMQRTPRTSANIQLRGLYVMLAWSTPVWRTVVNVNPLYAFKPSVLEQALQSQTHGHVQDVLYSGFKRANI